MENLFFKLVNMSITASWVVLAVIIFRIIFKKCPKWIICILWSFAAIRLVCPFSFECVMSIIPSTTILSNNILFASESAVTNEIPSLGGAVDAANFIAHSQVTETSYTQAILSASSIIWLIGLLVMLAYAVFSCVNIRIKLREAVLMEDNIYLCDHISSPFIFGIFRPRIYLPATITQDDAHFVVLHERAHISRRDYIWKPFGFLLLCIYWFNPIIWLAYILFCRDVEFACDEKVIRFLDLKTKKEYSFALVNCSTKQKLVTACPVAFGETGVKKRIKSILSYKKPALWITIAALIVCTAVAICILTNPQAPSANFSAGYYSMSREIYTDGRFSYCVKDEDAPTVEISHDSSMIYLFNNEELLFGFLMSESKLSEKNFDNLFSCSNGFAENIDSSDLRKNNKLTYSINFSQDESGIIPYMLLRQKDGTLYIVYANVEKGKADCVRWIYEMKAMKNSEYPVPN